jgi:hypothetical protein
MRLLHENEGLRFCKHNLITPTYQEAGPLPTFGKRVMEKRGET